MSSHSQILFKQNQLSAELANCMPEAWLSPVSGSVFNYRSKARLGVKFVDKKNRVLVGFREKMKPYIADIDSCPVLREPVATLIGPLSALIGSLDNPRSVPQIEIAIGDLKAALIFRHLDQLREHELELFRIFAQTQEVDVYLQPGGMQSVHKLFPDDHEERL